VPVRKEVIKKNKKEGKEEKILHLSTKKGGP
jgi:hypothetical protein